MSKNVKQKNRHMLVTKGGVQGKSVHISKSKVRLAQPKPKRYTFPVEVSYVK